MKLLDHIQGLRKAQLQEYYVRWFPSEQMTGDTNKLVQRLQIAMCDPKIIRERFDRLSRSARNFLISLLGQPEYSATVEEVRSSPSGGSIESFEIETLVRNLSSEGWIVPMSDMSNGVRREVYVLPEEIGRGLGVTVDVEFRDAAQMLSLKAFLAKNRAGASSREQILGEIRPEASLERLTEIESIRERIDGLEQELREAVYLALEHHCGILPVSAWDAGGERLHRPDWRAQLESRSLGTTGVLSLKRYGIDLEEECLVVFQEVTESYARGVMAKNEAENDKEYCIGVDLLVDIRRVIEIARGEALEVTREGMVFKKTEDKIGSQLLTSAYQELFGGAPVHHVIALCKTLRVLDQGDRYLRVDPMRQRLWMKKPLRSMIRTIFEIYQNDNRGSRWSFHQRVIRDIFLERLIEFADHGWLPAKPMITLAISRFLATVEERNVAQTVKDLQLEEFHNETLVVPLSRLSQDLSYWVVHRLALVGFANLGFQEGNFNSLQLSSVGGQFFKLDSTQNERTKIVVNPDFEILLFPGGTGYEDANYALASFADRTASEWIKRFRLSSESVKRGVISGYAAAEILELLEKMSENPVPPNVTFSIREWADGVEPVLRQRVLLLKTRSSRGTDQLAEMLEEQEVPHERVGDTAVVIRGAKNERRIRQLQEILHNAGLILE